MGTPCPWTIADCGAGCSRPGSRANAGWVGAASRTRRRRAHITPHTSRRRSMNIFVGNLNWETTEAELEQLFYAYSTVESVRIMTDRVTGRPRGFGFVEMPDANEAQAAIEGLNGSSLAGRALTVNEARQREDRNAPRREPRRERW